MKKNLRIHLIGVGGVAMGNLAAMLRHIGHSVSGSDVPLYPPMSDRLAEWGIEILPFDARNVKGADLCIVGNAISRGNVEVEEILNSGIDYTSMSAALSRFFLKGRRVIVVAGTHGKTTTTFLTDHLISVVDRPPGLFAGGVRGDGMNGWRVSDSDLFVIEGDEYDTAFFDKHSKFLHYRPRHLILTSVEFDHADIFKDLDDYETAFRRLLRLIPSNGSVVACADYPAVVRILDGYALAPVRLYCSDSSAGHASIRREGNRVDFGDFGVCERFPLIGDHNALNALAAVTVLRDIGFDPRKLVDALPSFPGVLRRQQIRVDRERCGPAGASITVIEDFAHHPTAVQKTLEAVRRAYPGRKIHALFEPRSASSHRSIFQSEYGGAFGDADSVYMTDVFNPGKVHDEIRLNVRAVLEEIRSRRSTLSGATIETHFAEGPERLFDLFAEKFRPNAAGDAIVIMSNGSFGGIYEKMDRLIASIE
jgi:UDP-N-acetylmuramate: L-alanyl-gamma-D-glutamyl-meso-diaminopimelate ligase